jgi:transcriptional regulator with XRE-family HTH domain
MALRYVGSRLPEWFKKTGKKQVDLARYLKVSPAFISRVCKNLDELSVDKLKMAAIFFGCNMDDLVIYTNEPD